MVHPGPCSAMDSQSKWRHRGKATLGAKALAALIACSKELFKRLPEMTLHCHGALARTRAKATEEDEQQVQGGPTSQRIKAQSGSGPTGANGLSLTTNRHGSTHSR